MNILKKVLPLHTIHFFNLIVQNLWSIFTDQPVELTYINTCMSFHSSKKSSIIKKIQQIPLLCGCYHLVAISIHCIFICSLFLSRQVPVI